MPFSVYCGICQICKEPLATPTIQWENKHSFLEAIFCKDIVINIGSFLTHPHGHDVVYATRAGIDPLGQNYAASDSDDESHQSVRMCTRCFEHGLRQSMRSLGCLPYLRRHAIYFHKRYLKNIITPKLKFFLPRFYCLHFYRQRQPQWAGRNLFRIAPF